MVGGYVLMDPTEVPTVMHTKFPTTVMVFGVVRIKELIVTPPCFPQGFRVNADADAYVETLQTILVKPPWIDSTVLCLLTRFGSIPLSSQNPGLDGRKFSLSCHTKRVLKCLTHPVSSDGALHLISSDPKPLAPQSTSVNDKSKIPEEIGPAKPVFLANETVSKMAAQNTGPNPCGLDEQLVDNAKRKILVS
ncbi:hypothetical protein ACTXT7_005183 [Hymenolepis weldensis]